MRSYLIVDDNVPFAENLAEILEAQGWRATVVSGGNEALRAAAYEKFDAVVTDMKMPVMGGAELVHSIHKIDPGLPAIVITAHSGDAELNDLRQHGILALLPKPVPIQIMIALLAAARRDALVAVVEDDDAQSEALERALRKSGFTVVSGHSVPQLIAMKELTPSAAVVDLHESSERLTNDMGQLSTRFQGVPILLVVSAAQSALPLNAHGLLSQPMNVADVTRALEELHRQKSARP
jgi:two-component system, response regulator PdtaR